MTFLKSLRAPGYRRSVFLRRALALVLVLIAVVHSLVSQTSDPLVVAFTGPVQAGAVVDSAQIELRRYPLDAVPENALTDPALATGQILAASASRGEIVTTTRLIGPDLARDLVAHEPPGTEPFSMVPVALAEPDIIPLLHHGATVSVITASPDGAVPVTIAHGGRVVLAGNAEENAGATVMLLLRESQATAVAAASLSTPLTVILGGTTPSVAP